MNIDNCKHTSKIFGDKDAFGKVGARPKRNYIS